MNFSKIIAYSLRIVNRNRAYSVINLLGLSLGLIVFTLIILFVNYESGYDRYHVNYDRIYRIIRDGEAEYLGSTKMVIVSAPLADAIKETVKGTDRVTRICRRKEALVMADGRSFFEKEIHAVDPDAFKIFSFDVIAGEKINLLTDPANVVISESMAIKYFSSPQEAIGKTLSVEASQQLGDHVVQAVIRDMPFQSHFRMDIIFQFESTVKTLQPRDLTDWKNNNYWIYLTLREGTDIPAAEKALNAYVAPNLKQDHPPICLFQSLSDVYLGERMNFDLAVVSDKDRLYVFLFIAVLVLVIACINYINMATARAANRAKEIGVRKVNGALRVDLIIQFLAEAFMSVIAAAAIALGAVLLMLPLYNVFLDKQISLDLLLQPGSLLFVGSLIFVVAMIAGAYPAFLFSSFKPIDTLKGTFRQSHNSRLRNILVVFQFVVSGTLVFGTLIVWKQMSFMKNKDLGFNRDHIIIVPIRDIELRRKHSEIREALLRHPGIINVSASQQVPTGIRSNMSRNWQTKEAGEQVLSVYHNQIDSNYLRLYDMKLLAGSNLSVNSQKNDAVVNEELVRQLGYTNEEVIGVAFPHGDTTRIVGVVSDFHFQDFRLKIEPVDFKRFNWGPPQFLSVKVEGNSIQSSLDHIESTLASISEKYPFEYTFYDEYYGRTFITEAKTSKLMSVFTTVAIMIAALGLYGLILHMVNQRLKEIGIRKTLGAGSLSIVRLLSGKFGILILVGYAISCVVGYYGVVRWLDGFAYKISPTMSDFVITLVAIGLIAGLAVYSRIAVALRINPAAVLKQE